MKKNINYKFILGIQCFATMDSGACIIRTKKNSNSYDYVAISEERLIRKKHPYTFPTHSIKYCMDYFKIKSFKEIDLLVSDIIREPVWYRSGPSYNVKEFDYIKSILNFPDKKIFQINHHLAHAASVYYTSGFKNSAILIVDGNGTDLETNSFYEGRGDKIKLIDRYKARGIGVLYNTITKDCLNLGTGGEGKTMGLAPYGNKGKPILDFSKVKYNGVVTDYSPILKRMPYSDILSFNKKILIKKLNFKLKKRHPTENILKNKWKRIAYDVQNEAERCMIHLGKEIKKRVNSNNICIAGGVALNSVANQKLFDNTKFKDIFVYPACSDAGVPFGLAIWALYKHPIFKIRKRKIFKLKNAYTGITYDNDKIKSVLKKYKLQYKNINLKKIAQFLSEGKIIGWFQGGSEYGPRALGNRSILADSRNPKMKDIVNNRVKHRENYRPFAPAVLEEDYKKYFKLKRPSPYMLLVAKVKNPKIIPSVTHVDGTARVQSVNKKQNEIFYKLIKHFKKITGIGCILNTSFNDAGEPIVETPEDAIIGMLNSEIDYLVLGNQVLDSNKIDKSIKNKMTKDRIKRIKFNEKKAIKLLTRNYNNLKRKKYFKNEEKKAYWNAIEKPYFDLNNQIDKWIKNKRKIILFGTYDQTTLLLKKINKFKKLNIIGFLPYKNINDDINNKKKMKISFKKLKNISRKLSSEADVLISSYEFSYDIERELNKKYPFINYFKFYSGYSRDILYLFGKKKNFMKIIMYHYVRDFKNTEYKRIKGLDIKKFKLQIKYLLSKYNILDPDEIHEIIENKKFFKIKDCWLTFDDGYIDHYKYVFPILEQYKIKASFFPPVESTIQQRILDVNKIHFILASCENKKNILDKIKNNYLNYDKNNNVERFENILKKTNLKNRYDDHETMLIKQLLQTILPYNTRTKICDDLFKQYVSEDMYSFAKKLYMNISQVKEMHNCGHEIGLHGYNHLWLGKLTKKDQANEILKALDFWKTNNIIKDKFTMCYPYGDYNQDTLEILSNNNCCIGLTTKVGSVPIKDYIPYELPRYDTNDFIQI